MERQWDDSRSGSEGRGVLGGFSSLILNKYEYENYCRYINYMNDSLYVIMCIIMC